MELIPVSWQSVSPQVHKPGGMLPLLSTRPPVTFKAKAKAKKFGLKAKAKD